MNIFDSDYWKLTVFLQKHIGLWFFPRNRWYNYAAWIYVYGFTISFAVAMGVRWYNELGVNAEIVIENTVAELFLFIIFTKLTCSIFYKDEFKYLYQKVAKDWKIITEPDELKVLHKYTAIGSKICYYYAACMLTASVLFLGIPVCSPLLDFIIPLENATRPKALPFYAEYGVDIEKYYYPLITQATIGGPGTMLVGLTFDLGFILVVHHVVALFKIVNLRLYKAAAIAVNLENSKNYAIDDYYARRHIVSAIELHKSIISFINLVEKAYRLVWFTTLFCCIAMEGGAISIIVMKTRPEDVFRFVVSLFGGLVHGYCISLSGQKIINCSEDILNQCFNCHWYNLSEKSKGLIKIMMMRSLIRCKLTGCEMFIVCIENYNKMIKTGYTIFTVLNS